MSATYFHFAYGANMSERVVLARRRVKPLSREVARLPGYRLVFDAAGVPLVEPSFANVQIAEGSEVWGVLYKLTAHDMALLRRYEGRAYRTADVTVMGERRGATAAIVFQSKYPSDEQRPSRRYRDALVQGAREQGLPAAYVQRLSHIETSHVPLISGVAKLSFSFLEALHHRGLSVTNLLEWARDARHRRHPPR